jgi:hypothetical protein
MMLEFILEYRDEGQTIFAWLACLAAFRWGGGPERGFASVWLAVFLIVHPGYHVITAEPLRLDQMDVFHAGLDVVAMIALVMIALNANRFYSLWIAAFQIIATSAHLVRELVDAVSPIVYAIMVIAPSYFQLAIFAGGLFFHIRRKRHHGTYRDWRDPAWLTADRIKSAWGTGGFGRRTN